MTQHTRPHAYVPGGSAVSGASIDDLIRPGLRLAFPLPSESDPNEDRFRHVLDALAQRRSGPLSPALIRAATD
jgi:hypothetical protein